jgi:hypothetical protein
MPTGPIGTGNTFFDWEFENGVGEGENGGCLTAGIEKATHIPNADGVISGGGENEWTKADMT